jgi:hypothetical protein
LRILWRGRIASAARMGTESQFCKGKVVRAQLRRDDRKLHKISVVDRISSKIRLITGRFLDLW